MKNEKNIKVDHDGGNFSIYKNNSLQGNFSAKCIIKYITENISHNFFDKVECERRTIEKYFCKVLKSGEIRLETHLKSPLMGNMELLMKIYYDIAKLENTLIMEELEKNQITIIEKNKLEDQIKTLIYLLLNHILKLINDISKTIKNDTTKEDLRSSLLKYNMFVMGKINELIFDRMSRNKKDHIMLELELNQIKEAKKYTDSKITLMEKNIKIQEKEINKIIKYIDEKLDDAEILIDNNYNSDNESIASIVNDNDEEKIMDIEHRNNMFDELDNSEPENEYSESDIKKINIEYLTPTK